MGSFDVRGLYGLDGVAPGFDGPVEYMVRVESDADEEVVQEVLDWVDETSPLIDILTKPVELRRTVQLNRHAVKQACS